MKPKIEIDAIKWDEKQNAFIITYTMYDSDDRPILTDTALIEHTGDYADMHYTTIETLKKILKDKVYETKTKN
jgi:hypothetical protein